MKKINKTSQQYKQVQLIALFTQNCILRLLHLSFGQLYEHFIILPSWMWGLPCWPSFLVISTSCILIQSTQILLQTKNSKMITWILWVKHKFKKLILWTPCICKLLLCCILQQNQLLIFINDNQGCQACVQKSGQMPFKTRPKRAQCSDAEDARDCFSTYACVLGLITGMWLFDLM